jgi:integrase
MKTVSVQVRHKIKTTAYEIAKQRLDAKLNKDQSKHPVSIAEAAERYFNSLEGVIKPTTVGEYAYQIRKYFLTEFSDYSVASITAEEIRKSLKTFLDLGLSVSTVNTIRARVSGMYTFLVNEGYVEKNPCINVRRFKSSAGESTLVQKPWTLKEVRSALSIASDDGLELFLHLAIFTGLRRGEVLALRWGSFDPDQKILNITSSRIEARAFHGGVITSGTFEQEPKTSSSQRSVFCSDEVVRAILRARRRFSERFERLPDESDYLVFNRDGKGYAPSSLGARFRRFCDQNGLRRIRLHDLRHTSAVIALEAGVPLEAVSEGLGHAGVEVTKRIYAPNVPGLRSRYATQLADHISASPVAAAARAVEEYDHA